MRDILISSHNTIDETYTELLKWTRRYENAIRTGTAMCQFCNMPKGNHLVDDRCSSSVTSRTFTNVDKEMAGKVDDATSLIEELLALNI